MSDTQSDIYLSWAEYDEKIEQLAVKIYRSGWEFNQILCLARGGLRVGDIFSRIFNKPLAILSASSYDDKVRRPRLTFAKSISMTTPTLGDKVLLVDDLVDSGMTLGQTIVWLNEHEHYDVSEIRTAVIWYKAVSIYVPDFYVDYLPDSPWIHQPFEKYEHMDIAKLAQK
ncbi:putative phosphoribosyltransferase [Synechococcus sp. PCC 7502]|uniref:phosphoribosyltransferase n=1 Tax=Synechococcus sp. PCC 7502 TaxID=1173263 RepID=UPI00029FE69A|nr:phosphoribosyltransferase family protein [Synechococcus sp. PCC 7502]AFY73316.1 putative phosphoribosyltransferase [Synechococcus sp. PCC 7502]